MKTKNIKVRNQDMAKSIAKLADDKEMIRLFLKGKITIKDLNERGINFAKPI